MGFFARCIATRSRSRARRPARPTHRRARLEPLEERTLLSLTSADDGADEYAFQPLAAESAGWDESPLSEPNEQNGVYILPISPTVGDDQPPVIALDPPWPSGGEVVPGQLVVSFRTSERIEDIGAYIESLDWPAWLGPITADSVLDSFSHLGSDGQYATLVCLSYDGVVAPEDAASLLRTLPFVYLIVA